MSVDSGGFAAGSGFRVGRGVSWAVRAGGRDAGGGVRPAAAERGSGSQPVLCGPSHPTFPGLVRCESDGASRGRRAAAAVGEAPPPGRRGGRAARPPEETGVDHRAEERCGAGTGTGRRLGTAGGPWAGRALLSSFSGGMGCTVGSRLFPCGCA